MDKVYEWFLKNNIFIDFLERKRERMKRGEENKHINVRRKHWSVASYTHRDQGLKPQLGYMP